MEKITVIKCVRKGKNFLIETDSSDSAVKMHMEIVLFYGIKKHSKFDSVKWQIILEENSMKLARNYALNLLTASFKTEKEIRKKLKTKKFSSAVIEKLIEELKNLALINDKQFAEDYTKDLIRRGFGKKAVRFKLKQKGITDNIIDDIIEKCCDSRTEAEAAQAVFEKRYKLLLKTEKDPYKRREKMYRFLCSKGFSAEVISDLMSSMHRNESDFC
jgi:regulatory protein